MFFPDSQKIDCRCEGAVLRPRTGDGPALLLLRLRHKADAVQKFLGLNEQITALSKEVHQRKQAQARLEVAVQQKEVLLREVHHRVKNNMQVISALLELHGLDIVDPRARQILQEVRNRIRVIAQVHERLYSNENLEHVHMASFLEQLVPDLFRVYKPAGQDISLVLTLEPVKADMDTAMTCGLLVHELIANALEHAFPRQGISGERSGTVEVALYPADAGEMAVLRISDDGVGLPLGFDLAAAQTVGLQLVSSMTQQLGGSVTVDTANGTTFTITFGG
ncbi:MAG: sensor histidine kinase [Dehalococcoidia bacterium]